MFGDQPTNGEEAAHKGYGIHVPFETVTTENLLEAINQVLNDPKYTNEVRRRGQLLLDQVKKLKTLRQKLCFYSKTVFTRISMHSGSTLTLTLGPKYF